MATERTKNKKNQYEEWLSEDEELTEEFTDNINKLFFDMLKNPTDKKIETFRTLRDALIIAWLADLLDKFKIQLKNSNLLGYNEAKRQLDAKKITKIVNKELKKSKILNLYKSKIDSLISYITYVSNGIKINSDRAINDLKRNLLENQKTISTEIAESFSDYGITYYTDRAGRRRDIKKYIRQKVLDALMDVTRSALFYEAIARGVDLVRVIHLKISPIPCPLCRPYENKVLSILGLTDGFETVEEAKMNGLFTHPNCDHEGQELELAPDDVKPEDKIINHSEENKKQKNSNLGKFFGI